MSRQNEERELRETKRIIKKLGNKRRRKKLRVEDLDEDNDNEEFYEDEGFGEARSDVYNGMLLDAKRYRGGKKDKPEK